MSTFVTTLLASLAVLDEAEARTKKKPDYRTEEMILKQDLKVEKREPFVQRPTKGKTKRKKLLPSQGRKSNIGDPNTGMSSKSKK